MFEILERSPNTYSSTFSRKFSMGYIQFRKKKKPTSDGLLDILRQVVKDTHVLAGVRAGRCGLRFETEERGRCCWMRV